MGDIIQFAGKYKGNPDIIQSAEAAAQMLTQRRAEALDKAVDLAAVAAVGTLQSIGFPITNQFDVGILIEVLKSGAKRSIGEFHPLQLIADEVVVVINSKGERVQSDGSIYKDNANTGPDPQIA